MCLLGPALGGMTDTNTEALMAFRISDPRLAGLVYLLLVLTGIFNLLFKNFNYIKILEIII